MVVLFMEQKVDQCSWNWFLLMTMI